MVDKADWRLQGQERCLLNKTIHRREWAAPSADWEHEHCAFCWAKFAASPGALREGYATEDGKFWICHACFDDFKDAFHWIVAAP